MTPLAPPDPHAAPAAGVAPAATGTGTAAGPADLPLSLSQREVWLDQQIWPDSWHLNIGGGAYLEGPLDLGLFRRALQLLVDESESLRLVPQSAGGQKLLAAYNATLDIVDLPPQRDPRAAMRDWWTRAIRQPFALDLAPPWRFTLLRAGGTDGLLHGLTIQFHHLVMDGWGTTQVMKRWAELYNALARGETPARGDDSAYRRFITDSLAYRDSDAFEDDGSFWQAQFEGLPPPALHRLYTPPPSSHHLPESHVMVERLARGIYDEVEACAEVLGVTSFVIVLATVALYLARISDQREVVIGIPTLNRRGQRYKGTPGMFVGVLPLRIQVPPEASVPSFIREISQVLRAALRHPRYPLSELGRSLRLMQHKRDGLFDAILSYERQDYSVRFGEAALVQSRQIFSGLSRYPLGVTVCEFDPHDDVEIAIEASSECFVGHDAALLARRLCTLMRTLTRAGEAAVRDIDLLSDDERAAVLGDVHRDVVRHGELPTFIRQFERQAALYPHASALVWDEGAMDYGTLDRRANALAHRLAALGAGRDRIVALAMPRSPEIMVAMLAVAKAGAAYLPLDDQAPPERVGVILRESGAVALLLPEENRERFGHLHPQALVVPPEHAMDEAAAPPDGAPSPQDLAYVLFTSGSTGTPKGVMLEHDTLSRRLAWLSRTYGVQRSDRSAQATQVTFDPSLIELFLPLINGASVALPPPGRWLPEKLAEFAVRHAVTIMAFVPATLNRFLDAAAGNPGLRLRVACCGGEILSPELAARYLESTRARLFNVYGPTETAIFATAWECRLQDADDVLPIGRPVDDTRIYVLDRDRRVLPFGVIGEIWIGGRAVARGYVNRPELDADAFVADPFVPGARMYRTGDRGWLGSDGVLRFVGRQDRQIKVRGYRIELGEIEATLLACGKLRQAAVRLVEVAGKRRIHAWVAPDDAISHGDLRGWAASRLPDYMLPSTITFLPALPTGSTGKVDYHALPDPAPMTGEALPVAPRTTLEAQLLSLWEGVLPHRPISVVDDFFDVGGDSLAAIEILLGIEKLTGKPASLHMLIERPTIEKLAAALESGVTDTACIIPLSARLDRPPVYLAASGHGDRIRFQLLADALGDACTLYMLQPPPADGVPTVDKLAHYYVDQLLKHGVERCHVAGFSVGGITALETARLLKVYGVRVETLFLLDTIYPRRTFTSPLSWRVLGWFVRFFGLQDLTMNGRKLGANFKDAGLVAQVAALARYRPERYGGATVLVKSTGVANWSRWLFGPWRNRVTGDYAERWVPGMHGSIFEPAHVGHLAQAIASSIAQKDDEQVPA